MQGFGKYSALHQAHARANAEKTDRAAAQERKAAGREVTDRRSARKDRDQVQPPAATRAAMEAVQQASALRPSRPMTADAWSQLLPNGPAPGESERGYIVRRHASEQQVRERRLTERKEAGAAARTEPLDTNSGQRNQKIQAILDRRAAAARQAQEPLEQDKWLGAQIGDD